MRKTKIKLSFTDFSNFFGLGITFIALLGKINFFTAEFTESRKPYLGVRSGFTYTK